MRIRTNLIIEETLLAKIDRLAGDRNKRAAIIETALREFIAREELKETNDPKVEAVGVKAARKTKRAEL